MSGETNLEALLGSMKPHLVEGLFVFVTGPEGGLPAGAEPQMVFREAEGTTWILEQSEALAHGLEFEFPCRMISLEVHSSLEAVGFLARITAALAARGMGVNPVSGFYHDHLFVPEARATEAMEILAQFAKGEAG